MKQKFKILLVVYLVAADLILSRSLRLAQAQTNPSRTAPTAGNITASQNRQELELAEKIKNNPNDTQSLGELAHLYFDTGRFDQSRQLYNQGLKKFPHDAGLLSGLANLDRYFGQYRESEKLFL